MLSTVKPNVRRWYPGTPATLETRTTRRPGILGGMDEGGIESGTLLADGSTVVAAGVDPVTGDPVILAVIREHHGQPYRLTGGDRKPDSRRSPRRPNSTPPGSQQLFTQTPSSSSLTSTAWTTQPSDQSAAGTRSVHCSESDTRKATERLNPRSEPVRRTVLQAV